MADSKIKLSPDAFKPAHVSADEKEKNRHSGVDLYARCDSAFKAKQSCDHQFLDLGFHFCRVDHHLVCVTTQSKHAELELYLPAA